jgi:hypothetical protein
MITETLPDVMKDRKTTYSVSNDALFCQQKTTENKQYDN